MAGKRKKKASPDTRKFVQVHSNPSMGIETSTGQAWAGVDQQVGHGSADALFGLTTDQYVDFMTTGGYGSPYMGGSAGAASIPTSSCFILLVVRGNPSNGCRTELA